MSAFAYLRVSTQEQSLHGVSLPAQEERVGAYMRLRGLELGGVVRDEGVSGWKPLVSRPGGKRLLKAIRSRDCDAVVVVKLDRAFRNCADCLTNAENWLRQGVALHIVDLGGASCDLSQAAGKFMLTVMAAAAEMERNLIAERTSAAMDHLRRRNRRISATAPFGWDVGPDGRTLARNEAEQKAIAHMKALRVRGRSLREIANALALEGIGTKNGGSWKANTVRMILKREAKLTA